MAASTIVQYVVVRKDLISTMKWPVGAVIAQACHACTAAITLWKNDATTQQYTEAGKLDNMHKCVLEINSEEELKVLSEQLEAAEIKHKLWVEQPENYPTCLATKPYEKGQVRMHFKKFKLFS